MTDTEQNHWHSHITVDAKFRHLGDGRFEVLGGYEECMAEREGREPRTETWEGVDINGYPLMPDSG